MLTLLLLLTLPGHAAPELRSLEVPWVGGERVRETAWVQGVPVEGWSRVARPQAPRLQVNVPLPPGRPLRAHALSEVEVEGLALARAQALGRGLLWPPRAEPVWLPVGDALEPAWGVDVGLASPPMTFRVVVDEQGTVRSTRPTSFTGDGRYYPGSPATSDLTVGPLPRLTSNTELAGDHCHVASCDDWLIEDGLFGVSDCYALSNHATSTVGTFLFDPDPGSIVDPFAEVQLYFHLDLVSEWFLATYGFARAEPIQGIVNFPMANAFFGDFDGDGKGDVSFGHTDNGVDFAYDHDVVYHEFGHAVVSDVSQLGFVAADELGLNWVGGGLNEGISDVFSMLITGDPHLGEYAGTGFEGRESIRELGELLRCPNDLRGEVHADGELVGSLAWQMMQDTRLGTATTAQLFYGALTTWTYQTGWPEAGQSLLDAASELQQAGELDADGVSAVGEWLDAANWLGCERILPLDDGSEGELLLMNLGMGGDFARLPGEVQYTIDVSEDTETLRVEVVDFSSSSEELAYSVFLRHGQPVEHEVVSLAAFGVSMAKPVTWDHTIDAYEPTAIEITGEDLHTGTWYVSVASLNDGELELLEPVWGRVRLRADALEPEKGGGCGCATGGSAWWGFLPLLLLVRRRR